MYNLRWYLLSIFLIVFLSSSLGWAQAEIPTSAPANSGNSQGRELADLVKARLYAERQTIRTGELLYVHFSLTNLVDEVLTLWVPNWPNNNANPEDMGLPVQHVFSGRHFSALSIEETSTSVMETQVYRQPQGPVPMIKLAPHASVGLRLEVTQYYRLLRQPGEYELVWRPYNGAVQSASLHISVIGEQQAVIKTNYGNMTVRFYYDEAPRHVKNFLELVEERFYNNLGFHRVIPGGLIQGGCPHGDGYGVRPDGKRLKAEFSDIQFKKGIVGMARSSKDPDSASCQFFICLGRQPSFDRKQTAFGYLVGEKSFEVLEKIAHVQTTGSPEFRPIKDEAVYINTISLENVLQEQGRKRRVSGSSELKSGQALRNASRSEDEALSRRRQLSKGMRVLQRKRSAPSTTQPADEQGR